MPTLPKPRRSYPVVAKHAQYFQVWLEIWFESIILNGPAVNPSPFAVTAKAPFMPFAKWAVPVFDYLVDLMEKIWVALGKIGLFGMDKPIFFVQYLRTICVK